MIFNRAHDQRSLDAPDVQLLAADDLPAGRPSPPGAGRPRAAARPARSSWPATVPRPMPCPRAVTVAGVELRVVGRAQLTSSLPFERPDLDAQRAYGNDPTDVDPDPPPAYLLVEGSRAAAANPGLADVGRTYRWTAPLRADAVHAWTVEPVTRCDRRRSSASSPARPTTTPCAPRRRRSATKSPAAGPPPAGSSSSAPWHWPSSSPSPCSPGWSSEAMSASRSGGSDGRARRRSGSASSSPSRCSCRPSARGIVGLVLGTLVVAWLAAITGTPVGPLLVAAIGQPGTLTLAVATALVAAGGVAGRHPRDAPPRVPGRPAARSAGRRVCARLAARWPARASATSSCGAPSAGPSWSSCRPLLAFGVAGAFLVVVPGVLRAVARRSARLRLPLRLAILSLAREPARPAATLTLLALSVGALVFAAAYGATVRTGIADGAAFETGADLRVAEAGTGLILSGTVVPVDRYAALGPGVEAWPVVRRTTRVEPAGQRHPARDRPGVGRPAGRLAERLLGAQRGRDRPASGRVRAISGSPVTAWRAAPRHSTSS